MWRLEPQSVVPRLSHHPPHFSLAGAYFSDKVGGVFCFLRHVAAIVVVE